MARISSHVDAMIGHIREMSLASMEGERLGNEDDLLIRFGGSRATIRQAARLVERNGLLDVRRGAMGGYYAARPSLDLIISVVCTYLDTLGYDDRHVGKIATSLWVDAVRDAANADPARIAHFVDDFSARLQNLRPDASIKEISRLEQDSWLGIFDLIDGGYFKLLFRINASFAAGHRSQSFSDMSNDEMATFVLRWKSAKSAELIALRAGDQACAIIAALNTRRLWGDDDPAVQRALIV